MLVCNVCGRQSKKKSIIDKCKHTRKKEKHQVIENVAIEKKTIESEDVSNKMLIVHFSDIHINAKKRFKEFEHVLSMFERIIPLNCATFITGDIFENTKKLNDEDVYLFKRFIAILAAKTKNIIIIAGNHDVKQAKHQIDNGNEIDGALCNVILDYNSVKNYAKKEDVIQVPLLQTETTLHYIRKSGIYDNLIYPFKIYALTLVDGKSMAPIDLKCAQEPNKIHLFLSHFIIKDLFAYSEDTYVQRPNMDQLQEYNLCLLGDWHENYINKNISYPGSLIQHDMGESYDKGFNVWNKGNWKFIRVLNPFGFVNIKIDETNIEGDNIPLHITNVIKGKISYQNTTIDFVKKIHKQMYERFKTNMECVDVALPLYDFMKYKNESRSRSAYLSTIIDNEHQREYIKLYLKNDMTHLIKILELHDNIHKQIKENTTKPTLSNLSLLSLEFSNLFCFGEKNVICFTDLKDTISGVIANNASGKTSIINILFIAIYGALPEQRKGDNINHMTIKDFVRTGCSMGSVKLQMQDNEYLYVVKRIFGNKSSASLTMTDKNNNNVEIKDIVEVNKRMMGIIAPSEVLANLNIVRQNNYLGLFTLKDSELKCELLNILGINKMKNADIAKEMLSNKTTELSKMGARMLINEEKEEEELNLKKLSQRHQELSSRHSQLLLELENCEEYRDHIRLQLEKIELTEIINTFHDISNCNTEIEIEEPMRTLNNFYNDLESYKLIKATINYASQKLQFNANCACCRLNQKTLETSVDEQIQLCEEHITKQTKIIKQIEDKNKKNLCIKRLESINVDLNKSSKKWNSILFNLFKISEQIGICETTIQSIQNKLQATEKSKLLSIGLKEEIELLQQYINLFNAKNGIPVLLINDMLKEIVNQMNKITSLLAGFSLFLEDKGGIMRFYIQNQSHSTLPFSTASGAQRFIASIILRITLSQMTKANVPEFLIIDEGFGNLDAKMLDSVCKFLDTIKSSYRFMWIISHISQVKKIIQQKYSICIKDKVSALYKEI